MEYLLIKTTNKLLVDGKKLTKEEKLLTSDAIFYKIIL